jgi:hypothetical protein
MSDYFEGEVTQKYFDEESISEIVSGGNSGNDFHLQDGNYWLISTHKHMKAAAHAINCHDAMLETLDNLMYYLETDDMKYLDLNKARAVIAKAKGEQQ